jgi:predicted membrane metal-binding protein
LHRADELKPGSARQFGLVMAVFFAILCTIASWRGAWAWAAIWASFVAFFGLATLVAPRMLDPLNRLWFRFGLLLHAIVNPLVMGLMFFVVITPIGLLMRTLGKRPIPLRPDRTTASYWLSRETAPGPMTKQY